MEQMRREIDWIFDRSIGDLRSDRAFGRLFDEARFGCSVDLQEQGDSYVIRAYLPDRDLKNVNVTVVKQTLNIEENEGNGQNSTTMRKAGYAQLLTLPNPVQQDEMQIERKEGMVAITLPKAQDDA